VPTRAVATGAPMRLFIKGVGFVPGIVARGSGSFLGIRFDLPASVERDLLIRKIFTSGLDTTAVNVSTWSATLGMIRRIWSVPTTTSAKPVAAGPAASVAKLPAASVVILPRQRDHSLTDLAEERAALAA